MSNLYPINSLFIYRIIFMATLLIGEGLFCVHLERKNHFVIRLIVGVILCFGFAVAFPIPTNNPFYSMMMFLVMFGFTYVVGLFLFDVKWEMLLFCYVLGYTIEHVSYELYYALSCFFVAGDLNYGGLYDYDNIKLFANALDLTLYLVSFVNIYWIAFILFGRKIKNDDAFEYGQSIRFLIISSFFVLVDIVINSVSSFYATIHYERIYLGILASVNVLCCVIGILYLFELYYRQGLAKNLAILNQIREEEKRQYSISKETIEMINIKCHDFRHQIREIGKEHNINEESIRSINNLISIYDSSVKTSNDTLNVILSEKSLVCNHYGIIFSSIVDGDVLSFMGEEDIYSLFGNIIDNAIEAVKNLNSDQKIINLKVKKRGNIISISSSNPYKGKVVLINGLPKTTKSDQTKHGFGTKSIKMIAEKYNGTLEIKADQKIFSVTLLFILKE